MWKTLVQKWQTYEVRPSSHSDKTRMSYDRHAGQFGRSARGLGRLWPFAKTLPHGWAVGRINPRRDRMVAIRLRHQSCPGRVASHVRDLPCRSAVRSLVSV